MARAAYLERLPMRHPGDVSEIEAAIDAGTVRPGGLTAILGKTEGNGCVNDFTRAYATQSLRAALVGRLSPEHLAALPMVMSGGVEGGLSPHWLLLHEGEAPKTPGPALAIASRITRDLSPSEIGRIAQARLVREATLEAMAAAEIARPEDVHFVQVKCPLLTAERAAAAGGDVATRDMLRSMGLSRGASALGVAWALGEIGGLEQGRICADVEIWSARASCSAGVELMGCEVVVMGQSEVWSGPLAIKHTVMRDAIDAGAIAALLAEIAPGAPVGDPGPRLRAVLVKAEASKSGRIRGARHTMLEDSDIASTRHARGFVGGLVAGLVGFTEVFVSGGAEHQGPDGGGPVAFIYERENGA